MKWLRLYTSVAEDPKVQQLPAELFKHWINILCIANANEPRGYLPPVRDLAFRLRIRPTSCEKVVRKLCDARLLDVCAETPETFPKDSEKFSESFPQVCIHNWEKRQRESDNIAARVEKHRRRKDAASDTGAIRKVTLHETLPKRTVEADTDTDTDTDTEEISPLSGKVSSYAAVVAPAAPTAAASNGHNHWNDLSAKRTAEEVARRIRLRGNELTALMNYVKACPHLSHEMIIGETESFVAWLNKNHKAADPRIFYNRWLKPADHALSQQQEGKLAQNGHQHTTTDGPGSNGTNGHQVSERPKPDWEQRYEYLLAQKRGEAS